MATKVYKALKDVSIPKAKAVLGQDVEGNDLYQTEGRTYGEGDPVYAVDISPPILKRVEDGDLDDFLEPASESDFEEYQLPKVSPEHELERLAFEERGRETLTAEEIIENNTHNLDEDKAAQEEAAEEGTDKRNLFLAKKSAGDSSEGGSKGPKGKTGSKPKVSTASEADGDKG